MLQLEAFASHSPRRSRRNGVHMVPELDIPMLIIESTAGYQAIARFEEPPGKTQHANVRS
jgi:hypothetical protein